MQTIVRFWRQPCRPYRNFQLVFSVLTIQFVIAALSYTLTPAAAVAQYTHLNTTLGGPPYPYEELQSHLWRYLAAGNVITLGAMCCLLQLNLRRLFPVILPLLLMKGYVAVLWLAGWLADPAQRVFLAAALLDFTTCVVIGWFASRARRALARFGDSELVPRPVAWAAQVSSLAPDDP